MTVLKESLYAIFILLQLLFAFYLLLPFLAIIVKGLTSLFKIKSPGQRKKIATDKDFDFGVIITAHRETEFIFPLVDSLQKQSYTNLHIYVMADDCDISNLRFNDSRITVLRPAEALNAKVKSIDYAIRHFHKKHDAITIFDADNLVHPRFFEILNIYFKKGYEVVQPDFKPKNTNSHFARMDAIGDMFNFFIEREIRMDVGLSATVWGSGVTFASYLYDGISYKDLLGGFDKKLQSHLVQQVQRIAFAKEAILYDEKISSGQSLETQRTRWISAYFKYFGDSFRIFLKGFTRPSFNLVYFGLNLLRPPLFITIAAGFFFLIVNYFIDIRFMFIWLGILTLFLLSFIGIVLIKSKDIRFLTTILRLPLFVFRQIAALVKMKKASKSFLKTEHTQLLYIEDVLK